MVAGRSLRSAIEERGGVLFFNPASTGPRRFELPITAGVPPGGVCGELVRLG